jgi:hypothetical protein
MIALKTVSFAIIFSQQDTALFRCSHFERLWHATHTCRCLLLEVIAAVPSSVNVRAGLSKNDKRRSDYGGLDPARDSTLGKAYKNYCGVQGADVEILNKATFGVPNHYQPLVQGDELKVIRRMCSTGCDKHVFVCQKAHYSMSGMDKG